MHLLLHRRLLTDASARLGLVALLLPLAAAAGEPSPTLRLAEASVSTRLGFDSNPVAVGGSAATALGETDTLTTVVGAGFGVALGAPAQPPAATVTYAGEWQHFDRRTTEDFSSHRFGLTAATGTGPWKFTAEASSLFIAGRRDTLPSLATFNANGLSLWRERRRQWQDRARLQARGDFGALVVRGTGTWLNYDYLTRAVAGQVAFADRSDLQGALELGWKQNSHSLWLGGVRVGEQRQATVPLPNCEFAYSNRYHRLTAGWEGKPTADTTLSFAAGPDFRRYTGAIDPRVFLGGRDRTSLWCEGAFTTKLSPALTLTGKAARIDWLSSTGKSAYLDTSADAALNYTFTPTWTGRLTGKVHRCDYFPTVRDDWESFLGGGATCKLTPRATLTCDITQHRGWNGIANLPERSFRRAMLSLGCAVRI